MSMTRHAEPAVGTPPAPGRKESDGRTAQRPLALRLLARPEVGVFLGAVAVYVFFLISAPPVREASAMANLACGNAGLGLVHALTSAPDVHLPHGYQNGVLLPHVAAFNRPALFKSFSVWRVSLGAGFLGALASQFWFIGFALTSAANVRTLALVEILLAQLVQGHMFAQRGTRQDLIGMGLIVVGAGTLILATA